MDLHKRCTELLPYDSGGSGGIYASKDRTKITYCSCPTGPFTPLETINLGKQLNFTKLGPAVEWIHNSFGENLKTILWLICDILADYGDKRAWVLYGPSNTGKSTTMGIIKMIFCPKITTIPVQYLVDKVGVSRHYGNSLSETVFRKSLSTRIGVGKDL